MCDEEVEVDVAKLTAKAEALEAERRRKEILQALKKRQARLGFSDEAAAAATAQDEEESSSSEVVAEAELQKEEKKEKKTKKKDEVKNEKKNHRQELNLINDYFRKPAVEVEEKKRKTRAYFKPRTVKRLKLAVLISIVVAVLMAVLPEKKEIVWNN